ncbi:hypothetical protein F0L17_25405 [Streptomyces sp. TRM43335]|uniref:Uncharacterized protein n=1 Tax=Streptomyces taklimakanensis TaxID=2569853 RepID=A0A6G2BJX8_9ACTN|nr:hypothetical protein [Streptomyces taklimakanensis]MTE22379.1 hypothetical protein [Streptomyces taklimakanensis]
MREQILAGGAAVTSASAFLVDAPWPVAVGFGLVGYLVLLSASVFPQESRDRLDWWRDRRRHRREVEKGRRAK